MKNYKSSSATNITYIDHSNTSVEFGITPDTNISDSLFSIMKNNTIILFEEEQPIQVIEKEIEYPQSSKLIEIK